MNKKIAISGIAILASLTLLWVGVYAAYISTATMSTNNFSTTTPSLLISTGSGYGTSATGFTETGIVPGGTGAPHTFYLKNASDSSAPMALSGQFNYVSGPPGIWNDLTISISCDNGGAVSGLITNWQTSQNLGPLGQGAETTCTMTASLPGGNTTDAGQTATFNAVFSGSVGS